MRHDHDTTDAATVDARHRSGRLRALLALVALAVTCALTLSAPATATVDPAVEEARLYHLTNAARVAAGLPPLAYDPVATAVARHWSGELARSGSLRHNPDLVPAISYYVTPAWQRLAENAGRSRSTEAVHGAYMASEPHRANILGDFNRVGVGVVADASGRLWTTVIFLQGPPVGG